MKDQSTKSFIQCLDILQSLRGKMTTIILDSTSSHCAVHKHYCSHTLNEILGSDDKKALAAKGVRFIIAESKRHQKVSLAEKTVHNTKRLLNILFPNTKIIPDLFQLNHMLSLIQSYLNNWLTYSMGNHYMTPYIFDIAALRRANDADIGVMPVMSHYFLPKTDLVKKLVDMLAKDSRKLLTTLAGEIGGRVLNFRNTIDSDLPTVDQLVIVPDHVLRQKFSSLTGAIGRVESVLNRTITIRMLDNRIIVRQNKSIISAEFMKSDNKIDVLSLPLYGWHNCLPMQPFESQFNLPKESWDNNILLGDDDDNEDQIEVPTDNLDDEILNEPILQPRVELIDTTLSSPQGGQRRQPKE